MMKKILLPLLFAFTLTACIDYSDVTQEVTAKVKLQMPADFTEGTDFAGHSVVLKLGDKTLIATTDENGIATFKGVVPDVYSISTSWDISNELFAALTGKSGLSTRGAVVSGALNDQVIAENSTNEPILLPTNVAVKGDIIISKIASAGSKDINNRSYLAGKYLELYNQADESVDISGLYIGLLESSSPQAFTLEQLQSSFGGDMVICKQIFQIPTDKTYEVAPGTSVLLTNSAIDHRGWDERAGKFIRPNEAILTDADFEAKDESGTLINNPNTPGLLTAATSSGSTATMNLVQGGPCGIIIFRTDENIDDWERTYGYGKTSDPKYVAVPKRLILDAVDYLKKKATGVDVTTKRLFADIDASYINITSISGWTLEVVYRKTASVTPDGRIILKDTNNSLNDFKVSTTIKPREYDTTVE